MTPPCSHYIWTPPSIGAYTVGRTEGIREDGEPFSANWSGTYLGIVRDDGTGDPMHLFVDGQINGEPQTCFSHPAKIDPAATLSSSTTMVEEWYSSRVVGIARHAQREVLVHLNVTLGPADAHRTAALIAEEIMEALSIGLDRTLDVTMTLAEEA